jgi:hypothetical protein
MEAFNYATHVKLQECNENSGWEDTTKEETEQVGKLECVSKFSYLGDMIGSGGLSEEVSRATVWCAWGMCGELAAILPSRATQRVKGKVYSACVQGVIKVKDADLYSGVSQQGRF